MLSIGLDEGAIVVSDIQSMISLFRYAMNKKLPRFKIIPLDILKYP